MTENLGKVLNQKDNPDEPVMDCVAEVDAKIGGIASDIRDIFAEAKSAGFDVKAMRTVLKLRKMNAADRDEQELVVETYRKALNF